MSTNLNYILEDNIYIYITIFKGHFIYIFIYLLTTLHHAKERGPCSKIVIYSPQLQTLFNV